MKFRILCADRPKHDPLDAYQADFIKRISRLGSLSVEFIETNRFSKLGEAERRKAETEALLEKVEKGDFLVALDEAGREWSSRDFAEWLQELGTRGRPRVTFIIGGAYGLDDSIKKSAGAILSLSRLTFTSQLARALLVEQLYRALTIIHGMPYHKD